MFCPHTMTGGWEECGKFSYEDFLTLDFYWLLRCDAIYMLPGWENSRGAKMEHMLAKARGIPIRYATESSAAEPQPAAGSDS